ncbi:MAG: phage N-6-adenine-methyltransferase, partial [Candidatus Heimdallarchaeota archaeon]|nr:phage N-6-adenine-methyltransferase [Candidatus Heimdallarchaeota archaeon]
LMKEKYGDDVDFIYMDTGAEHPKTYEFIRKVNEDFLDKRLVCLRVKINPELGKGNSYEVVDINDCKPDLVPFKDMMSKYGTPYIHGAFCTDRMKSKPYKQYCNDTYGNNGYKTWLGIRIDEPKRLRDMDSAQVDMFGEAVKDKEFHYMAEISDFDKRDVLDWWEEQDFDLGIPEPLGNCVFCIKKGVNKLALAARYEPEMAADFISAITSSSVRIVEKRKQQGVVMYRGNNTLETIIASHSDFSTDQIESTIRSMGREKSGSCTESCEAFVCTTDNYDLFE